MIPRNPLRLVALIVALPSMGIIAACALLGGHDLRDLKLSSISALDQNNAADIAPLGYSKWLDRPMLVIRFRTKQDLNKYAKDYEYNVGNDASLCRNDEMDASQSLQNIPYVFDAAGQVDAYRKEDSTETPPSSNRTTYLIYIAIKSIALAGQSVFDYDLQRDPKDICIQLRGGNMLGDKFVSNVIVVPKAVIVEALSHH